MSIVSYGDFKCAHPGHTIAIAQQLDHQWNLEERAQLETEARAAKMKRDESMELVGFAVGEKLLTDERDPLFMAIKTMHDRLETSAPTYPDHPSTTVPTPKLADIKQTGEA